MTPIRTNKPLFFNSVGEPLNGTVWIGQPSQDPRTNPKTVTFRDAGGSEFTASQPLTTINGRIVYNGKPIVALVDGEHSMLVFDSSGAQVDYSRSVNATGAGGGQVADFSELTRVGLTLAEIKGFDVNVGEVIENIGKVTAEDRKGHRWLTISATGSPADDENLIDIDNGLQARIITDFGPRIVWEGSATSVNMTELDSADRGAGRYLVYVGSVYSELAITDNASFVRSLLDTDIGGEFLAIESVRYSAFSSTFTATSESITNLSTAPATLEVALNITKIEKF